MSVGSATQGWYRPLCPLQPEVASPNLLQPTPSQQSTILSGCDSCVPQSTAKSHRHWRWTGESGADLPCWVFRQLSRWWHGQPPASPAQSAAGFASRPLHWTCRAPTPQAAVRQGAPYSGHPHPPHHYHRTLRLHRHHRSVGCCLGSRECRPFMWWGTESVSHCTPTLPTPDRTAAAVPPRRYQTVEAPRTDHWLTTSFTRLSRPR